MIYWRMYVQDYLSATSRLSMIEHGAYMLLLAYYYADEHPLPADKDDVYRIVRAITPIERKAVDNVLKKFFSLKEDGWHQDRADHEIEVSRTARENGSGGGRPKTGKVTGSGTGSITGPQTETGTEQGTGTETGEVTQKVTGSGHPFSLSTKNNPINQTLTSQPSNLSTKTTVKTVTAASAHKTRAPRKPLETAETWGSYATAYEQRYHIQPVRNAKVNTHISRFVGRVGETEAPAIAAFYLTHSKASYVSSKHDAKFLEMDAEGLRTEWATGQRVTQTQANQADRTQATGSVFQKLIDEAEATARLTA